MARSKRSPIFTVETPVQIASTVVLWEDTWNLHIEPFHPEMAGRFANMYAALKAPTLVCEGSNPDYLMFVNSSDVDVSGKALVVCVNPFHNDGPSVVTSYHGGSKYTTGKVKKVWP